MLLGQMAEVINSTYWEGWGRKAASLEQLGLQCGLKVNLGILVNPVFKYNLILKKAGDSD